MDLIKCPQCGERYSSSYSRCPFCEEDGVDTRKFRRGNRRTVDRHAGQSARGGLIVVLILVLALLGWYLFGSDIYHSRKDKGGKNDTETVAPTDDSVPVIAPAQEDAEPPADEAPAVEPSADETPADEPQEPAVPEQPPEENVDVSGAKLNRNDFTLSVKGEKYTIKLSGTEATPHWSIDNPNVATIAGDGTVTAVANGNTTAHCKVGSRDLTCTVRVRGTGSTAAPASAPMVAEPITPVAPPQPAAQTPTAQTPAANTGTSTDANVDVSGAKLNRKDFTLSRGEKFTVKLSGTTAVPRWDVDDPNVAVIDENGVVTGIGGGKTKLHCKVGDRDLTCIVRVK